MPFIYKSSLSMYIIIDEISLTIRTILENYFAFTMFYAI